MTDTFKIDASKVDASKGGAERIPVLQVFLVFLRLGCTSFGGPVAHLGYFHQEFVTRRRWLAEAAYADLMALCQFLPGPASSQVGIGIGLAKAGLPGALAAWIGFTAPSAILMMLFGFGVIAFQDRIPPGMLHGLKVVAVAVVAQAVWTMARALAPDAPRASLAAAAAVLVLLWPGPVSQFGVILAGGVIGWLGLRGAEQTGQGASLGVTLNRGLAAAALGLFFALLLGLPLLRVALDSQALAMVDGFYRAGSLVFGGGHVVLPLLQTTVVPTGWVDNDQFLAGYGAAQALPGPLFTFAAYLGTVSGPAPNGVAGGLIALAGIFLSSFLLVIGALPFWEGLRRHAAFRRALVGINAAVVGLLLAALYNPVWTSGILAPADFALAILCFLLLAMWKWPPWLVVILSAFLGGLLAWV